MQGATRGKRALTQQLQVAAAVTVAEEAGQSIVAALDNVLRYAWNIESWLACHATSLAARTDRKSRCPVIHLVRPGLVHQSAEVNLTSFRNEPGK
jgi:hypothetical protein